MEKEEKEKKMMKKCEREKRKIENFRRKKMCFLKKAERKEN